MDLIVAIDTYKNDIFDLIMDWLEEHAHGKYTLRMINWIVYIEFKDLAQAVHFKLRWHNVVD